MKLWKKSVALTAALLAFGAVRLPFEVGLSRELSHAGLTPMELKIGTLDRIGQTSSAVALGGLRTLIASFLNLRAFTFFSEQRWDDLEKTFGLIVDLAPRTRYYWETGSWHMAYNAASYYINDSKLPPLRRREAWRSSILKGRAFLERGVLNNPNDWSILANLGFLLSDTNKIAAFRDSNEAFAAAAEAYRRSAATGNALAYVNRAEFYSLARVQGKESEALALAHELYGEGIHNHTPTLLAVMLALEAHQNPAMDVGQRAVELFKTPARAYETLSTYWMRARERLPMFGIFEALHSLEKRLVIPGEKSIFNKPVPAPPSVDDLFGR